MERNRAQTSAWTKMQDAAGGLIDDSAQRAQRGNRIMRDPEPVERDMTLRGDLAASSDFQKNAQAQFDAAQAASEAKSKANEKYYHYSSLGYSPEELAAMGVVLQK